MLVAEDTQATIAFYRDVLGGEVIYGFPPEDPVFVTLRLGTDSEIGIGGVAGEPVHGVAQRPVSGHRIELCVYVDDVDRTVEIARAHGSPVRLEPVDQPWGERIAYVEDPAGNLVMLTAEIAA